MLVVTEGKRTEPSYLRQLARAIRATGVEIRTTHVVGAGVDPERVVREALRIRDEVADGFDETWCLVDVDRHAKLSAAVELAQRHGVSIAVSNPCFEIWLLWHHEDMHAHTSAPDLKRRLRPFGVDSKEVPPSFPFQRYSEAMRRSAHAAPGLAPGSVGPNPSTSVGALITALLP